MKTRLFTLSLAALLGISASALAGSFHAASPFLRDESGRAVFLHGVNAVWKVAPYYPPASAFDERDAQFLADNGFNSVRLGVLFAGVMPGAGTVSSDYLQKIDDLVRMLGAKGVTVLLDFHQDLYNERFQGEGFPAWATHTEAAADQPIPGVGAAPAAVLTAPPDAMASFGFPANYFTPPVMRAFDNLWLNNFGLWAGYAEAWKAVAARFAGRDNVVGYDLLNEPWPGTQWVTCANPAGCPAFDAERMQPFFEYVIDAIRSADSTGVAFWEPNVTNDFGVTNNVGLVTPIRDAAANNGISFHDYCLAGGATPALGRASDPECPIAEQLTFQRQREAAARNGSALFLTEFGASDDLVDIARVAALADANMVSWHWWQYESFSDITGNPAEESLFADDANRPASLKQAKADLLIRTYPQAVAGTPRSFGFDPASGDFALVYEAGASSTSPTTVIFVPVARHYRGAYDVTVAGPARVTSPPNAPSLTLENTGAGEVTVTVKKHPAP